ncbi:hypothetical protein J6590_104943, partial [Homalodisca vitripennis]
AVNAKRQRKLSRQQRSEIQFTNFYPFNCNLVSVTEFQMRGKNRTTIKLLLGFGAV